MRVTARRRVFPAIEDVRARCAPAPGRDALLQSLLGQAGWTVRSGSSPRVLVAEKADRALYGSTVTELWRQVRGEATNG